MKKRVAKLITDQKDIDFLLNIKYEDITLSFMMKTFGKINKKSRFNPYDILVIPPDSYGPKGKRNKNKFRTTVGVWIYNKFFIENLLFDLFHYINKTIDKKVMKKIDGKLAYSVLEDKITTDTLSEYENRVEKMMPCISILSPGITEKMLLSSKEMNKKKKQIYPKYKERIEKGDPLAAEEMEKELKDYARLYLDGDPSMDSYNSGARGDFDNHYKNMYIMKGAIKDPDPDKGYNIMLSNFVDGVSKEEYGTFANSLAAGPFNRARKTADGGYWEKEFLYAYQHVVLEKEGSDCGSKTYKTVTLTKDNVSLWMYSFIVEGSRLVELNSDNVDKYMNKTVKFRFSAFCHSKTGVCNACIGNLPYKLGIKNIGMVLPKIPSVLKSLSMKSFHESLVKSVEMDVGKAFGIQ